jgi:hypothetical protein
MPRMGRGNNVREIPVICVQLPTMNHEQITKDIIGGAMAVSQHHWPEGAETKHRTLAAKRHKRRKGQAGVFCASCAFLRQEICANS